MAISLKHKFESTVPDQPKPGLVRPSDWNDEHDLTLSSGYLVGRTSPGDGPAESIPVSSFATADQGAKADSALQSFDVAAAVHAASSKSTPVDADEFALIDSAASFGLKRLTWANLKTAFKAYFNPREVLTANRTYYVLTTGSDSNTGLVNTSGGAFLTGQKAIDTVAALDLSIYNVTIQFGAGTYTQNLVLKTLVGSGSVTLQGDTTTPSNVVLSPASGSCLNVSNITGLWNITGFKTISAGGAIQLLVSGAYLNIGVMDYGDAASNGIHIYEGTGARINQSAVATTISATTFGYHIYLDNNSVFYGNSTRATTLTGNPTFISYVSATNGANLRNGVETFSGSVTSGSKYNISQNATVASAGGANPYPGTIAGTTSTGGQYV